MQQDYPEIVTKLQLLLSTGMNLRKSVERIAGDYVSYMRREEVRKAYEILMEVCGEMERGLGEKEAYEQLGERWGLLSYRTLSSILVQCLQKGSVGVEQILAKRRNRRSGFAGSRRRSWGAGIHQAAVPDDFNVARGVCDFAGAGMADIRSLTVENRNMSYL